MGFCKDCLWCHIEDNTNLLTVMFRDKNYYCTNINVYLVENRERYRGDMFKVSPDGSCKQFTPHPTADEIGYKKSGGCFLTSACVEYMGKSDDCEELTVLRGFRDGYMKSLYGGEDLIKEYYEVAPTIVEKINESREKDKYYKYINGIIDKCVGLIGSEKNESALDEYTKMVHKLKAEFDI